MRRGTVCAALVAALLLIAAAPAGAVDYATAPFSTSVDGTHFGQAPVFMPDGRVVYGKDLGDGSGTQIYIGDRADTQHTCLTCDHPAPNDVPAVRPKGDWILYHSWEGHHVTVGAPGFGGLGSELWVMRPDGTG